MTADSYASKMGDGTEREMETWIDYAYQRYYNSQLGRFHTADPYNGSAILPAPQSWNRYGYAPMICSPPNLLFFTLSSPSATSLLRKNQTGAVSSGKVTEIQPLLPTVTGCLFAWPLVAPDRLPMLGEETRQLDRGTNRLKNG